MEISVTVWCLPMNFPTRLIQLRKDLQLSQQALSNIVGIHVNQIKRYEAGTTQPTLEALVKLAKALHVSLDALVFDEDERGPDNDLRLQFEAINELDNEDKKVIREVLESLIVKYQTKKWSRLSKQR